MMATHISSQRCAMSLKGWSVRCVLPFTRRPVCSGTAVMTPTVPSLTSVFAQASLPRTYLNQAILVAAALIGMFRQLDTKLLLLSDLSKQRCFLELSSAEWSRLA